MKLFGRSSHTHVSHQGTHTYGPNHAMLPHFDGLMFSVRAKTQGCWVVGSLLLLLPALDAGLPVGCWARVHTALWPACHAHPIWLRGPWLCDRVCDLRPVQLLIIEYITLFPTTFTDPKQNTNLGNLDVDYRK